MSEAFQQSLESGPHQLFARLEGNWSGVTRTWFEPGVLADESPQEGTMRVILGGRFLQHDYKSSLQGNPTEGMAIIGHALSDGVFHCAWIDSFHNGTSIMFCKGQELTNGFAVLGHYYDPPWGWRTEIELVENDELRITMYNISPEGEEAKAVETVYKRG